MSNYKQLVEEKRQAMLNSLLESIENNPARWERGWVAIDVPFNGQTLKNYNGINSLFLNAVATKRGYKDPRWVTFNQAKELGANVKNGERASEVFYWSRYDVKTKKPFDESSIEGMTDEEQVKYLKENVKMVLKFYQVFNAEQCDKFPENTRKNTMTEDERKAQNSIIETVIKNSAAPINYDGGENAYYNVREDAIHIPEIESFKSMNDYYATTLHEIGHSTGHKSRLNRDIENLFGSRNYAIEELRAELASVFMQSELGINLGDAEISNHGAYLKSWLSVVKNDPSEFYKAAADAGKISNYVKENYLTKANQQVEQVGQVELVNVEFPLKNRMNEYGKSTMFRMPQGVEFSSFVFLAPTKFVDINENVATLTVPSNFEFTLQNDGCEIKITGEELRTVIAGEKIGKSAQRVSAAKRNLERLDGLRSNVPSEMREMPNWCVFRTKWNDEKGKKDKFVLSPIDGKWARSNAPESWTDFETAYKYAVENNCEGLAFALDGSGISCIDLDKSIDADGKMNGIATQLSNELKDTYCEKSVSGNGLHFFVKDDILSDKYRNRAETEQGELEVYQTGRFISMTGNVVGITNKLSKCPIATISHLRKTLGTKTFDNAAESAVARSTPSGRASIDLRYQSDAEVIERIRRSKKGSAFDTLYSGGSITGDKSRDDLAMLNTLAFFTDCNESQMRSIFESSARFRPDTKNAAYLDRSIKKACDSLSVRFGEQQSGAQKHRGK